MRARSPDSSLDVSVLAMFRASLGVEAMLHHITEILNAREN